MLERLKDMLYEISDILLALVIILVMSTVITWKITDSMAYSSKGKEIIPTSDQISQPLQKPENPSAADNSQETTTVASTEESPAATVEASSPPSSEAASTESPATPVAPVVVVPVTPQPTNMQVVVPSGTSASGIAKLLKQKGLIDNTAKFIARIEELKLSSKLKSGTFSIPSDASMDEMIYVITGTKR